MGCNNAGSSNSASNINSATSVTKPVTSASVGFSGEAPEQTMNTVWTIDNASINIAQSQLKDLGWHLITVSVTKTDERTKTTPVNGLKAIIYPKPPFDHGQRVEIKDINCDSAIFSKVGDSCSAYFKFDYDHISNESNNLAIDFPVEIGSNSYPQIPGTVSLNSKVNPSSIVSDIRLIDPIESSYYNGNVIITNPKSYHIAIIQNGLYNPINIASIATSYNPVFTLINRTTNDDNDPIYGKYNECSGTSNQTLHQVNTLTNLNDACLLIYTAAESSSSAQEKLLVTPSTNANSSFPEQTFTVIQEYTPICNNANEPTIATADSLCSSYASQNSLYVDAGTVNFGPISHSDDGNICSMNAQANFYKIAPLIYSCDGVDVPVFNISTNKCNGATPTWGPIKLSGTSCVRTSLPAPCFATSRPARVVGGGEHIQEGSKVCGTPSWQSTFIAK